MIFDKIGKAVPRAFNAMDTAIRHGRDDKDTELYNSLDVSDLEAIAQKYGADSLVNYIEEMEKRKLKGGQNG